MYVVIELAYQIVVALCQLSLLLERYHSPECLVDAIKGSLHLQVEIVLGHFFLNVGHIVQGCDGTAHEEWLPHGDGTTPEIFGVGLESVTDGVSYLVSHLCEGFHHAV